MLVYLAQRPRTRRIGDANNSKCGSLAISPGIWLGCYHDTAHEARCIENRIQEIGRLDLLPNET